jgi:hypothetical protein
MHTSVCFPAQLVDSLRPQRSSKSKNNNKTNNNKQGGKGNQSGKNKGKRNQTESEDDLPSPRQSGGQGSPDGTPPPSGGKKKAFKNIKQQQREFQRLKKANKGKGGFSNFEMLDEDAEEQRRQAVLEVQLTKEEAQKQALAEALSAASRKGASSDDTASRGSLADADALEDVDEPTFSGFDLFEESDEQLAVRAHAHLFLSSHFYVFDQEKERRRLQALDEHNARLGGVDILAEKMATAAIDQQAEEEAIFADDTAPRCSYMGRYASFDPNELDAVIAFVH